MIFVKDANMWEKEVEFLLYRKRVIGKFGVSYATLLKIDHIII